MTNEDKTFFIGLTEGLKQDLRSEMRSMKEGLESQIRKVKTDLSAEIRHNGILIEDMKDDIDLILEGQEVTNHRLGNLEKDMKEVKETISDYPILRETVKKHSRQLVKIS